MSCFCRWRTKERVRGRRELIGWVPEVSVDEKMPKPVPAHVKYIKNLLKIPWLHMKKGVH